MLLVVPYFTLVLLYFSCPSGWELSTAQVGAKGLEGCYTFLLSLMYSLKQTITSIM
jgi:hypothetical protein